MRRAHALRRYAVLFAALAALPACDGCQGKKPYTPYTLSDAPDGSSSAAAPAVPADAGAPAPAFTAIPATAAPNEGKSWPLEGGAAEPPPGHTFVDGLVFDADGDGKPDLLAWSRAPDGLRGEIWFAPGKAPAEGRAVVALPADLASPGCNPTTALARIGAGMASFDFDPRCAGRAREKSARWIAVFRAKSGGAPELGLELRVAPLAEGETLAIALDGRDRDGDGRGDVTAAITLSGAPKPLPSGGSAQATLAYFDRPAGLSRDPSEPETSLKAIASALVADGRKKTTSPRVAGNAASARRLLALLCEDLGKPALTTTAGPIRCGETRIVEDSAIAEIEAQLNLGDPLGALAALSRLEAKRRDVDALVAKTIPSISGKLVRTTAASPAVEPPPSFGPIAFNSAGDLLVRTSNRVVRVDHGSFEESPVDAALEWPKRLAWPAGDAPTWTLTSIEERCDVPTLLAHFEAATSTLDVPLPVPTAARCTAQRLPAAMLGPSTQGDLVVVRGEILAIPREAAPHPAVAEQLALPSGSPVPLGAARSPDGNAVAIPTSRGVAVALLKGQSRNASVRFWTSPLTDNATACVPNNNADRIACAVRDAVAIYDAK
jgi:hypothetical protein